MRGLQALGSRHGTDSQSPHREAARGRVFGNLPRGSRPGSSGPHGSRDVGDRPRRCPEAARSPCGTGRFRTARVNWRYLRLSADRR